MWAASRGWQFIPDETEILVSAIPKCCRFAKLRRRRDAV
jgi:hypothetical protein